MLIRALGRPALEGAAFPYPKLLLLLTYVSLEGPQHRRRLAQLFWPSAADPRNRLSVSLGRIEKVLRGAVTGDRDFVATELRTDVASVREALSAGSLGGAVAAYTGRFMGGIALTGFGEELAEWVTSTADDVARSVQHAYLAMAEASAGEEQFGRAAAHAEAALDVGGLALLDPADMGRLHTLLVSGGSSRAASVRAETVPFETDLASTQAQARSRLRMGANTPAPAADGPVSQAVRGAVHAGEPHLVGRVTELEELASYLDSRDRRLITLTGPGGIGKSRLALAAAVQAESTGGYAGRTVVVKLETVSTPEEMLEAVADACGLADRCPDRCTELLAVRLGQGRHLLVLDNFEHLMGATGELLELLRRCPSVRLLVTSREPLNVSEEWQVYVEGLPFPPEREPSDVHTVITGEREALDAWPSLRLFELRARRSSHRFVLGEPNVQAVAAICRACLGSPLAVELAASWVGVMTPAEIAAELERNIDLLGTQNRDAVDRHRSIRAVFLSSWRLLSEQERALFRRLAAFRGGFELSAAREVASADLATLGSLVRKSFVIRDPGGRYYRHPLMRQFAVEKLAEEPLLEQAMLERHADHMRRLVVKAHAHLMDPTNSSWRARLEVEWPNVAAALAWAEENRDGRLVLDIVEALSEFWIWRGQIDEALRWTRTLAQLGAGEHDPHRYLKVMTRNIFLSAVTGDHASALTWHREAAALARELGSLADEARLWSHRGVVAAYQCDYAAAEDFYEKALEMATAAEDPNVIARVLNNLGDVNLFLGRYDQARSYFVRSLELERALGDRQMESNVLGSLALAELRLGDPAAAEARLRESAALVVSLGITFSLPTALEQFAQLASSVHRWSDGVRLMASAAALRETLGLPVEPFVRSERDAWRVAAEAALGAATVAEASEGGSAWPAERAVAWAMAAGFASS